MHGDIFQVNDQGSDLSVEPINGGVLEVEAAHGFVPEELAPIWVRRYHGELIVETVSRYSESIRLDPSRLPESTRQMIDELFKLGVIDYRDRHITINHSSVHMAFRRDAATDELRASVLELVERTWNELQPQPVA